MPASGISLVDANVWLALAFGDHVHHELAAQWFDLQTDATCAFCRLTQLALLRHLTNVKIMGQFVQSQQQAWAAYDLFVMDSRVVFLAEPPGTETEFRNQTQATTSAHSKWTDAYLAAFAKLCAVSVVTFDQGFQTFSGTSIVLLR